MTFSSSAKSTDAVHASWTATSNDGLTSTCAVPKEFGGPSTGVSPEDLYLEALTNCYIATLKVIAANSKMNFASIEASSELTLDKDSSNPTPWMTSAHLKFTVSGVDSVDRFQRLMERVSKQCMIWNSVKTAIQFEFVVNP